MNLSRDMDDFKLKNAKNMQNVFRLLFNGMNFNLTAKAYFKIPDFSCLNDTGRS